MPYQSRRVFKPRLYFLSLVVHGFANPVAVKSRGDDDPDYTDQGQSQVWPVKLHY
jgi:hypothetical protein